MNSYRCGLLLLVILTVFGCEQAPDQAQAVDEEPTETEEAAQIPSLTQAWMLDAGLDRPESVIYDAARDVLYVKNMVGDAAEMDGNGYIAKVSVAGEMLEQNWISGLNAPKGIAISGDRLWASDINALVEIDLEAGEVLNRFSVEDPVYLNDVTVHPDGSVFVTDSRYSKIYRFAEGAMTLWHESDQIQMPNGAHVIGDELVVVAGDVSAENPGQARYFQAISFSDQSIRSLAGSEPMVRWMP